MLPPRSATIFCLAASRLVSRTRSHKNERTQQHTGLASFRLPSMTLASKVKQTFPPFSGSSAFNQLQVWAKKDPHKTKSWMQEADLDLSVWSHTTLSLTAVIPSTLTASTTFCATDYDWMNSWPGTPGRGAVFCGFEGLLSFCRVSTGIGC